MVRTGKWSRLLEWRNSTTSSEEMMSVLNSYSVMLHFIDCGQHQHGCHQSGNSHYCRYVLYSNVKLYSGHCDVFNDDVIALSISIWWAELNQSISYHCNISVFRRQGKINKFIEGILSFRMVILPYQRHGGYLRFEILADKFFFHLYVLGLAGGQLFRRIYTYSILPVGRLLVYYYSTIFIQYYYIFRPAWSSSRHDWRVVTTTRDYSTIFLYTGSSMKMVVSVQKHCHCPLVWCYFTSWAIKIPVF